MIYAPKRYKNWESIPNTTRTTIERFFHIFSVKDFLKAIGETDATTTAFNISGVAAEPVDEQIALEGGAEFVREPNPPEPYFIIRNMLKTRGIMKRVVGSMMFSFAPELNLHAKFFDPGITDGAWMHRPCCLVNDSWKEYYEKRDRRLQWTAIGVHGYHCERFGVAVGVETVMKLKEKFGKNPQEFLKIVKQVARKDPSCFGKHRINKVMTVVCGADWHTA